MASEKLELVKAQEALSLARDKRLTMMRQCNTCRIANVCYAFKEDADCSLVTEVPTIKSDDDADALLAEVIRIQTERVLQSSAVEKAEGTLHPETDKQIELLSELLKTRQKQRQAKNSIRIEGSGEAGVSVLGSLMANLGRHTSGNATQRPEARHHSKFEERRSRDNLEAEDADFTPVIDVKPNTK